MTSLRARAAASLPDLGVAAVLFSGTLAVLLATTDVGFPRDEGFYFRHAADYQDWFWAVSHAEPKDKPFGREAVTRAWQANAEHPPLAKVLFGASWRAFGTKLRAVSHVEAPRKGDDEALHAWVDGVHDTEGFAKDAEVLLLRPPPIGSGGVIESAIAPRVLARGVVVETSGLRAKVRITADVGEGPALSPTTFSELCRPKPDESGVPVVGAGCQAVSAVARPLAETTAFRLPTMALGALLIATVYLFGVGVFGRTLQGRASALFAALALFFMPRGFLHMHFAAFDVPVTALMFAVVAAFWRSLRSRGWAVATGVLWGLAVLTKHNALFLPVVLVAWWLSGTRIVLGPNARPLPGWRAWVVGLSGALVLLVCWRALGGKGLALGLCAVLMGLTALDRRIALPPMPLAFLTMPAIGLPMLVLLWPRLWYDGWENFTWYLSFHLKHEHYMQVYFGDVLAYPPFPSSYPFVLTLLTVPLVTLGLIGLGAALRLWPWLRSWRLTGGAPGPRDPFTVGALLGWHGLYPIALIAIPSTPIFGGIKHWLPAMPFLCLLAGDAFGKGLVALIGLARPIAERALARVAVTATLLFVTLAPSARATLLAHPNGEAYWNELIGGLPGAANAGMQRQFWGYATGLGLAWLNARVPADGSVYFHKSPWGCWDLYRKEGLLRWDIRHAADLFDVGSLPADLARTDYAVFHHQKDHDDYEVGIWEAYGTDAPAAQFTQDGVPILSIYENPKRKAERESRQRQ